MTYLIAAVWVLFLLSACNTTRLDAQWSNPEFAGRKLSGTIMVVGLTRDETLRRLYEDALVDHLKERGIASVRSYEVLSGHLVLNGTVPLLMAARARNVSAIVSNVVIAREHV